MYLKCSISISSILLLLVTWFGFTQPADAYCSLEKMKEYAMEACEHLFQQDEIRSKRSLAYENNLVEDFNYSKFNEKKHYISRSIYPPGGYLKVGREHFHKLSQVNVQPKYKPKKLHHEKKERFKREHSLSYNNIPYCCYNRCEDDFFC